MREGLDLSNHVRYSLIRQSLSVPFAEPALWRGWHGERIDPLVSAAVMWLARRRHGEGETSCLI